MTHALPAVEGLRIVVVNWRDLRHPEAGGAEQYAWQLAVRLARSGARITYLTCAHAGAKRREVLDGVTVVRRGSGMTVYPAALAWLTLHRQAIDAVIDCQNGIPFFSPLAVGKNVPVMMVVHHVHQDQFATRFGPAMAAVGRTLEGPISRQVYRNRTVIAVSPSTRSDVRRRLHLTGPIVIIPNGTPEPEISTAQRCATPRILSLGRLVPHKRTDLLIRAVPALVARWPGLEVDIVGGGPSRPELEQLVAELGLGAVVHLHGRVDESMKRDLLAQAWLAVNPSMGEGWGITVMEAAATGLPTLAFDVAGLRDSILHGQTGWLIAPGSDLADGIDDALHALTSGEGTATVASQARAWASCFSWDESAARLQGAILEEIKRASSSAFIDRRKRSDAACVLEVDGLDAAQAAALQRTVRHTDVLSIAGDRASILLYACDERDGRRVAARAELTGDVHVRMAEHRDFLTVDARSRPGELVRTRW